MKAIKKRFGPLVFVIGSLILLGYLLGQEFYKKDPIEKAKESYADRIQNIKNDDLDIISDISQDPKKVYGALMRRAQNLDPKARVTAEKLLSSTNSTLQEAAYQAIGFYTDEEANNILSEGLKSPKQGTRTAVLRALGFRQSKERIALIQNILDTSSLNEREMILALEAMTRISPDAATRDKSSHEMLKIFKKSQSSAIRSDILLRISKNNPGFAPLENIFLEILKDPKQQQLHAFAIRQMAAYRSPWLQKNIEKFTAAEDTRVKISAIGVISSLCPENRWDLLEKILFKDHDRRVQMALEIAIKSLGSQKALVLLQQAIDSKSFSEEENSGFSALYKEIETHSQLSDSCQLKGKSGG